MAKKKSKPDDTKAPQKTANLTADEVAVTSAGASPLRAGNIVVFLLVGAFIGLVGLVIGGGAGYAFGRMQSQNNFREAQSGFPDFGSEFSGRPEGFRSGPGFDPEFDGRPDGFRSEPGQFDQPLQETPYLGVAIENFTPEIADRLNLPFEPGVLIINIDSNSPAAHVRLHELDVILGVNSERVESVDQLQHIILSLAPGDVIILEILREGEPHVIEVALGSR